MVESTWKQDRPSLLKTHYGWFAAYQDGKRVALEPDCDMLVKAVDKKLGSNRRPVTLHEIIETPIKHRGPSPRYFNGYRYRDEHGCYVPD